MEPPWDRERKFIQMVQVICCSSLLSTSGGGGGAGAFSRDLTINLSPQCRAFSRALKTEKLKAPLFPGPVGAGTTNDWCITCKLSHFCCSVNDGNEKWQIMNAEKKKHIDRQS